jgi:hypothetical protein
VFPWLKKYTEKTRSAYSIPPIVWFGAGKSRGVDSIHDVPKLLKTIHDRSAHFHDLKLGLVRNLGKVILAHGPTTKGLC